MFKENGVLGVMQGETTLFLRINQEMIQKPAISDEQGQQTFKHRFLCSED